MPHSRRAVSTAGPRAQGQAVAAALADDLRRAGAAGRDAAAAVGGASRGSSRQLRLRGRRLSVTRDQVAIPEMAATPTHAARSHLDGALLSIDAIPSMVISVNLTRADTVVSLYLQDCRSLHCRGRCHPCLQLGRGMHAASNQQDPRGDCNIHFRQFSK